MELNNIITVFEIYPCAAQRFVITLKKKPNNASDLVVDFPFYSFELKQDLSHNTVSHILNRKEDGHGSAHHDRHKLR